MCICIHISREGERERGTGTTCGSLGLHIICVGGVEDAAVPNMHSTRRKGVNSETHVKQQLRVCHESVFTICV